MTPTQKAKELVDKFGSKELAIICVEEIIINANNLVYDLLDDYHDKPFNYFWQEVKQEIKKIEPNKQNNQLK